MNEHKIKQFTLIAAGSLAALLVLWVSFGGKGDMSSLDIAAGDPSLEEPATVGPVAPPPVAPLPGEESTEESTTETTETETTATPEAAQTPTLCHSEIFALLSPNDTIRRLNRYEHHHDSMPPGGVKMRINSVGGTLGRVFNDSNYLHLEAARAIGIKPVESLRDAWNAGAGMERVNSCREYYLDNLTHSLPFLVPKAHRLLTDIGAAFRDSLASRGGGDYRIKVTSVLRTPALVKRLRRRNRNAVDTSAHMYGTTFDISYSKFICDSVTTPRTQEDMKNLLAEVVKDMRDQGRCYVKYEHKQSCFHITAR